MKVADPPKELLEQRPALAFEENVLHPETTPTITGKPPAKYTRALHERICEELRKGQRPQGACARAGITTATFYEWVRKGKAGDPWLYEFAEDVEIAFNTAEADALDTVTQGFRETDPEKKKPEDAKWYLERARPDGYSKQVKTAVEGQIKEFLQRLEHALEPALFERVLAVYLGQAPSGASQEMTLLPENASSEEANSSEEQR